MIFSPNCTKISIEIFKTMGAIMNCYYFTSSTKHNIYILHRNFQGFIQFQPEKSILPFKFAQNIPCWTLLLINSPSLWRLCSPHTPYPNNQQTNYAYWCSILGTVYNIIKCPGNCVQYYTGIDFWVKTSEKLYSTVKVRTPSIKLLSPTPTIYQSYIALCLKVINLPWITSSRQHTNGHVNEY